MSESPDWYDESKVIRAIYAVEGDKGHSSYGGYVQDLGDGTCRFTNSPLLGEGGPEWGDRVDLFYNPCDPFGRPMVGYRVYPEGVEPTGRNFGVRREPDEEEIAERQRLEKIREEQECARISANFDSMFGRLGAFKESFRASTWMIRYFELKHFLKEHDLEVPEDLHEKMNSFEFDRDEKETVEVRRKELKTMMLAVLKTQFDDIEVADEEVDNLARDYVDLSEEANILRQKVCEQIKAMEPDEEEDDDE